MGLFNNLFRKKENESENKIPDFMANVIAEGDDYDYVLKTAELISGNDMSVVEKVRDSIENTEEYAERNKKRYMDWDIDVDSCDRETLILTAFIDELTAGGYLYTADTSTEFDDFADGIMELSTYTSMNIDISEIEFNPDRNALEWGRVINQELTTRQLCCVDIGGEDLNLVWLSHETIEEIVDTVEKSEISLEAVGLKQY